MEQTENHPIKEIIKSSTLGLMGATVESVISASQEGGFLPRFSPLEGISGTRYLYFYPPTESGLEYATQYAGYKARALRLQEELPDLVEKLEPEQILDGIVPENIESEARRRIEDIFQNTRGVVVTLDKNAVKKLGYEIIDDPETVFEGGKALVINELDGKFPLTIIQELFPIGEYEKKASKQIKNIKIVE